jgi:ADP-heptose:LPS heptosyltransferase
MRKDKSLSIELYERIKGTVAPVLEQFLSISPDERLEREQHGENLATILTDALHPVIEHTRISSILILMEEGIGNMVMLTPVLRNLKSTHPGLKITVLCKNPAAQVIQGWECVDKVITEFDYNYYDLVYITIWGQQLAQKYSEELKQYTKYVLASSLKTFHETMQHMSVASFLESSTNLSDTHCQVAYDETSKSILDYTHNKGKYIIFANTALRLPGDPWKSKRWPYYIELAEIIKNKHPEYTVYLVGTKDDAEEFEGVKLPDNMDLKFFDSLDIPHLAYLISNAEFFVGNDSGPAHIAAAVGTKTYVLFAPTLISKNKPLGKNVTILHKNIPCSPCQYTERFGNCDCIGYMSAHEVYNEIFYPQQTKPSVLLVGDTSSGAFRNEISIKRVLEKELKMKVTMYEYRQRENKLKSNIEMTYELLNNIVHNSYDYVLICGGQTLVPDILSTLPRLSPKTKLINWYVDNRKTVEPWFARLSSICKASFWSTGDPNLLSKVFSQTQRPCMFLPITPDEHLFKPMPEVKKDIDVLFVGTPHSKERVELLEYLVKNGIKIEIYGDGKWPESLKKYVHPGVFDKDFVNLLNRAKLVLNINIVNDVPLYFSDRYFQPMAVKTVGLNKRVPNIEDMFEDKKHMLLYNAPEDCLKLIQEYLPKTEELQKISEEGHKLYIEKYTLTKMLNQMFEVI